jgi:hypothetical protein
LETKEAKSVDSAAKLSGKNIELQPIMESKDYVQDGSGN